MQMTHQRKSQTKTHPNKQIHWNLSPSRCRYDPKSLQRKVNSGGLSLLGIVMKTDGSMHQFLNPCRSSTSTTRKLNSLWTYITSINPLTLVQKRFETYPFFCCLFYDPSLNTLNIKMIEVIFINKL